MAEHIFENQFPLVFRVMAPLERLLLAATCCKHSRRSGDAGRLVIIEPTGAAQPAGVYSSATAVTRNVLRESVVALDSYETFQNYCRILFDQIDQDKRGLQGLRRAFDFPAVAQQSRFIPADTEPLVVPYTPPGKKISPTAALVARVKQGCTHKELLRLLRGYTVPVYRHTLERWERVDRAELIGPGLWAWKGNYDKLRGIGLESGSGSVEAVEDE